MDYQLFPPVRELVYLNGVCPLDSLQDTAKSANAAGLCLDLPPSFQPPMDEPDSGFWYSLGEGAGTPRIAQEQGFAITIQPRGLTVSAPDRQGLRYGLDTLGQIIRQAKNGSLNCLSLHDWPELKHRGLMVDLSRGKVFTREYLLSLARLLSRMRYNVLQLYVEHTYDFKSHPEISRGSDPLTREDILALQEQCLGLGIQLQANLQSLGHCRRILTRPAHRALAESDMFWSLSTTHQGSIQLLEDLYAQYLPLFHSPWLNVCLDEPYDLGRGQSKAKNIAPGELYLAHLLKLHGLAAKHGKRLMLFGDVFLRHPELLSHVPRDVILIDWIYDPKSHYDTPAVYGKNGIPFWISPGTGNWNTIFPRLEAALINIKNLTQEGIRQGAEGMLLTDWNDHGGYTQPAPSYFLYAYAAQVAWRGCDPGKEAAGAFADQALALPGYAAIILTLSDIYQLAPIWSKNRSQCVMALFDEPVMGAAIRGPLPPEGLIPNDLSLPEGVEMVYERHSQHPMRPIFSIPPEVCSQIRAITEEARPLAQALSSGQVQDQLLYILDAFDLMLDKLDFSRRLIQSVGEDAGLLELLGFEEELRLLIARFTRLQLAFSEIWLSVARFSEMEISMVYFAGIITRLDYLRDWLSLQREKLARGEDIDRQFISYETCGYTTLPTY